MDILYIKSFHIIFIVTWFAGLFYIVRLFIYHTEALEKEEPERSILSNEYKRITKLLWYIITWPSALLTLIFGPWLLYKMSGLLEFGFMHLKLAFVFLLYVYHYICHRFYLKLQAEEPVLNSFQLRIWNEVATLLLLGIVFLIVLKNALDTTIGIIGFFGTGILLMLGIKLYKRLRSKQ